MSERRSTLRAKPDRPQCSAGAGHGWTTPIIRAIRRGGVRTALVAILATMTAASAQVLVAAPASAEEAKPANSLPALPSEDPAQAAPALEPVGDLADVPAHPSEQGQGRRPNPGGGFDPARSTFVDSETTATQRVAANADGSKTCSRARGRCASRTRRRTTRGPTSTSASSPGPTAPWWPRPPRCRPASAPRPSATWPPSTRPPGPSCCATPTRWWPRPPWAPTTPRPRPPTPGPCPGAGTWSCL